MRPGWRPLARPVRSMRESLLLPCSLGFPFQWTSCSYGDFAFYPVFLRNWADEQICDEADNQQACHDMQYDRIGLLFGNVMGDVVIENSIHNQRTHDACGRPGCKQPSMNGTDVIAAE